MLRCYTLSPNRSERRLPAPNLLRHVSPLGWEHIVLTGDYDWNSGAAVWTNARPLNLYPARIRALALDAESNPWSNPTNKPCD